MSTNLEDSVVLITSSNPKYQDIIGTGFVIYREAGTTYLLTCAHVVEDVGGKDSVLIYGQPATVIASSDVNDFDLAVVQIKHEKLINRPVLKLQNYCQEGTSVKAAGYYLYSSEKKRSLQTIEGVLGKQKYREDQDTGERAIAWEININNEGQLQKGYSGSPVVDRDSGLVIGVVTNMGTGGQIGEIISVEALEIICPLLIEKIKLELKSEKGVDYTKLRDLLAEGKWKEADEKTGEVMCQAAGKEKEGLLGVKDIDQFPCKDLHTINQLWLYYSNGKFGFSVQKEIYENLDAMKKYNYDQKIWDNFCDRLGWRHDEGGNWLDYSDLTFELNAPPGHLPRPTFLFQNLPWVDRNSKYRGMQEAASYGHWSQVMGMSHSLFSLIDTCKLLPLISQPDSSKFLKSVGGIDYTKLDDLLKQQKWQEADWETARVMCPDTKEINKLKVVDINNFPSKNLRIINQLWLHYSNGKFGFSVQKEIYQSLEKTKDIWENFGDHVGWRKDGKWLRYYDLDFDINAPNGHLPCGSLSGILAMVSPSVYPVGLNYGGWIYKGTITPQPPMGGVPADASSSSETGCVDVVGCFGALFSRKDL